MQRSPDWRSPQVLDVGSDAGADRLMPILAAAGPWWLDRNGVLHWDALIAIVRRAEYWASRWSCSWRPEDASFFLTMEDPAGP